MPAVEQIAARHPELDDAPLRSRYALEGKLGRGGMGVVAEAQDRRIGRRVAIKRLAGPPTPAMVARFVREARIQGRLDHPAVVPVYDLGIQSDGRPYFAMRRLRGVTLAEVLHWQRAGDPEARERFGRTRLLAAFVDVCLAIAYAHSRGVIHRDLKPANVMLGDFGEVYVLDWGVAYFAGDGGGDRDGGDGIGEDLPPNSLQEEGAGTVGYMAPEQREGGPLDARADVYALGCLLAEILGDDPPAELAAVCAQARADDPDRRTASARALAEAVERHLDVDRDAAVGAERAAQHVAWARDRLGEDRDDPGRRAAAMREAGRALALDPSHREAAALVRTLLLEPPATPPPEVAAALDADDEAASRSQARTTALSYLGLVMLLPIIVWQGIRTWVYPAYFLGLAGLLALIALAGARGKLPRAWPWLTLAGNGLLLVGLSRFLGPFVVPPAVAVLVAMALAAHPRIAPGWLIAPGAAAGVLAAWALEEAGLLAATIGGEGGALILTATVVGLPPLPTTIGLVASLVTLLVVAGNLVRSVVEVHHATRRRLALQAWHLRHLVPGGEDRSVPR
jgi:eukaryotic-like serine/threonine-protein kinase